MVDEFGRIGLVFLSLIVALVLCLFIVLGLAIFVDDGPALSSRCEGGVRLFYEYGELKTGVTDPSCKR